MADSLPRQDQGARVTMTPHNIAIASLSAALAVSTPIMLTVLGCCAYIALSGG